MTVRTLHKPKYRVQDEITPFDERDNVQARHELDPDAPEWEPYYAEHPEWERKDLEIRALSGRSTGGFSR